MTEYRLISSTKEDLKPGGEAALRIKELEKQGWVVIGTEYKENMIWTKLKKN